MILDEPNRQNPYLFWFWVDVKKAEFLLKFGKSLETRIYKEGYLTLEQFAHENSLSKSTLYLVAHGEINTSIHNLHQYAQALGIPLSELLQGI